jgi:hypothetical protein
MAIEKAPAATHLARAAWLLSVRMFQLFRIKWLDTAG